MGGVKFSIVIDAPPERVFERLADVTTHPSWANPLTPEGGGTRLSKRVTSNGNPLIFFIAYPAVRADQMTSLRNLKRAAESSS